MGRLQRVMVDLDDASTQTDFEVIELMDESTPYPMLLGIDWAIDLNMVINLKKQTMIFETKSLRVAIPLDPAEGPCYIEPVCGREYEDDVDCSYKMSSQRQGWVKTAKDRRISLGDGESCTFDSEEEDERWCNRLNGVTTLHCNMVTKSLYYLRA